MSDRNAFGFGPDAQLGDEKEIVGRDKADPKKDHMRVRSVEELRAALTAGTYQIPSALVAGSLLRSALREPSARREPNCKFPSLERYNERQVH